MNKTHSLYIKIFWSSIALCFILATVFMIKRAASTHKRLTHIIIKPSSTNDIKVIAESLKKLLFPIYMEKKGVNIIPNNYPELTKELQKIFSIKKPHDISIQILRIDFSKEQDTPCLKEISQRMNKKKKKWIGKIFFSACTTDSKNLVVAIAEPLSH